MLGIKPQIINVTRQAGGIAGKILWSWIWRHGDSVTFLI
jgi:hypothetical protein